MLLEYPQDCEQAGLSPLQLSGREEGPAGEEQQVTSEGPEGDIRGCGGQGGEQDAQEGSWGSEAGECEVSASYAEASQETEESAAKRTIRHYGWDSMDRHDSGVPL